MLFLTSPHALEGQRHLMGSQHLPGVLPDRASLKFQVFPVHSNNLSHMAELISTKMCYCIDDEIDA